MVLLEENVCPCDRKGIKDHYYCFSFCLLKGHGPIFYCYGMNSIVLFCYATVRWIYISKSEKS